MLHFIAVMHTRMHTLTHLPMANACHVPIGMVVTFSHSENGPVPFTVLAATLNWYTLSVVRSSAVYLIFRVVAFATVLLLPFSLYSTT